MIYFKKLFFAPFFLISLALFFHSSTALLNSPDTLFSLDPRILISLITPLIFVLLSAISYSLLVTLASDWRLVAPIIAIGSLLPVLFYSSTPALVMVVGVVLSLALTYPMITSHLSTYLTFHPISIFSPSIRNLSRLLVLFLSIAYFLTLSSQIDSHGFQIPDSLINTALQFSPTPTQNNPPKDSSNLPLINPDQLQLLKARPELLKQYNIDPSALNQITSGINSSKAQDIVVKDVVKNQLQTMIKPYMSFIAPLLSLLFFLTLYSLLSIVNLLIYPLIWFIFYLLEQTNFVHFEKEMREVKKLVV